MVYGVPPFSLKLKCGSPEASSCGKIDQIGSGRAVCMLLKAGSRWMLVPYGIVWLGYLQPFGEGDDVKASKCVSSVEMGLPLCFLEDMGKV